MRAISRPIQRPSCAVHVRYCPSIAHAPQICKRFNRSAYSRSRASSIGIVSSVTILPLGKSQPEPEHVAIRVGGELLRSDLALLRVEVDRELDLPLLAPPVHEPIGFPVRRPHLQ